MICPNCGRKTQQSEKCEHCKQPTEFVHRFNIRPDKIPGMKEMYPNLTQQAGSLKRKIVPIFVVMSAVTILSVMINVFLGVKYMQLLGREKNVIPETMEVTVPSEENVLVEELEEIWILLYRNYASDELDSEMVGKIQYGVELPELPDSEDSIFLGWNTQRDGSGTSLQAGVPFVIPISENLSLYAQWEVREEQISATIYVESKDAHNAVDEIAQVPPSTEATNGDSTTENLLSTEKLENEENNDV